MAENVPKAESTPTIQESTGRVERTMAHRFWNKISNSEYVVDGGWLKNYALDKRMGHVTRALEDETLRLRIADDKLSTATTIEHTQNTVHFQTRQNADARIRSFAAERALIAN